MSADAASDSDRSHAPPKTADDVIARLTERFDQFSDQLQIAARFIIDRPREIGIHSMRALAQKADVHPNTFVRLAQAIGFDGFDPLRDLFRSFVAAGGLGAFADRARWLQELSSQGGASGVVAGMATATSDNLESMWRGQEPAALEAAADAALRARRVYVLGMGSAYSLAHQFWYVARMALDHVAPIPRSGSHPIDDLAWASAEDALIAITFQPYRAETMAAARRAKALGATLIGVTDSPTAPLARLSDHVLVAPTHTPQFFQSQAAAAALLEGFLALLVARAGSDALAKIEAFHKRRVEVGLYEEAAPLAQLG